MGNEIVYILDDNAMVRASVAAFLESAGFPSRQFSAPAMFLDEADNLSPGCVLLDVRMPEIDGFQVLQKLAEKRSVLPVVIMTGHGDVVTAVRAMKMGAHDFIEKPFEKNMLLGILARVFTMLDHTVRDRARQDDVTARLARLTDREREVLVGLLSGRSNKLIAYDLDISIRTVEMHRSAMMDRLGVRTFVGALRLAIEGGLAPPPTPNDLYVARGK